jgi:formylmethanofuran dehydrogenase subunit D
MNHITEVEHDPYLDEYFIKIPDEYLEEMKLKEGDEVDVQVENGSIIVKKI